MKDSEKNNSILPAKWFYDKESFSGWNTFIYSLPKAYKNHDSFALREFNAVISDGATPILEEWGRDLKYWGGTLTRLAAAHGTEMSKTLPQVWEDVVTEVNKVYPPLDYKRTICASHVRFNNHTIEAFSIGDTKIIMRKIDGNFLEIFDTRLTECEVEIAADEAAGIITHHMATLYNRARANQPGGYYVISSDPSVVREAYETTVDEYLIDNIIICTDGLWNLFRDDPEKMFYTVHDKNPSKLEQMISKSGEIKDDLTFIRLDKN